MVEFRPVANGVRTDHPIPDLPFVDDAHIPVADPMAIEAIGRKRQGPGRETWGRQDPIPGRPGWCAFTTDPRRHDLAWCVRWHPEHGRTVLLCRHADSAGMHMIWWGAPLLFRAGGYWWDGDAWYRPMQVWDAAAEEYVHREVPGANLVSAADVLARRGGAGRGRVHAVEELDLDALPLDGWHDDLARWARDRDDARSLSGCVVTLSAPELTGDQLIGLPELARIGGVAPATLRAYISRSEADVPQPQAVISGRSMWSRPVAEDWAERRRRSSDSVADSLSTTHRVGEYPAGITDLWNTFTQKFTSLLNTADVRKRFALRWRTPPAIRDLSEGLAWQVAAGLRHTVPLDALALTVQHAILDELATGRHAYRTTGEVPHIGDAEWYGILHGIARTLDWLIRHDPDLGGHTIATIIGQAEDRLGMPRPVTAASIRTALALDGQLGAETLNEYLERVLPPVAVRPHDRPAVVMVSTGQRSNSATTWQR